MNILESNFHDKIKIKNAYLQFYDQKSYQIAFTGTFKQAKRFHVNTFEYLTIEKASNSVDWFMHNASRKLLGRYAAKCGEQLNCAGYIEGNPKASQTGEQRLHVHLAIGGLPFPKYDLTKLSDINNIEFALGALWRRSPWGYNEVDISVLDKQDALHFESENWKSYIHKRFNSFETERHIYRAPNSNLPLNY